MLNPNTVLNGHDLLKAFYRTAFTCGNNAAEKTIEYINREANLSDIDFLVNEWLLESDIFPPLSDVDVSDNHIRAFSNALVQLPMFICKPSDMAMPYKEWYGVLEWIKSNPKMPLAVSMLYTVLDWISGEFIMLLPNATTAEFAAIGKLTTCITGDEERNGELYDLRWAMFVLEGETTMDMDKLLLLAAEVYALVRPQPTK